MHSREVKRPPEFKSVRYKEGKMKREKGKGKRRLEIPKVGERLRWRRAELGNGLLLPTHTRAINIDCLDPCLLSWFLGSFLSILRFEIGFINLMYFICFICFNVCGNQHAYTPSAVLHFYAARASAPTSAFMIKA